MERAFFEGNRRRFWEAVEGDGMVAVFSGRPQRRSADEDYPFHANRNFAYLTGLTQENLIYFGFRRDGQTEEILFLPQVDAMRERWRGRMLHPEQVMPMCGISHVESRERFEDFFRDFQQENPSLPLYLDMDPPSPWQALEPAQQWAELWKDRMCVRDCHGILTGLRMVKQPCEIAALRRAIALTDQGIRILIGACYEGIYEYQLKNVFNTVVADQARELAFDTIVAAGKNALCMHYPEQDAPVKNGDMVLLDLGAREDFLCADISRMFPVSGHFTARQRALCQASLDTITFLCASVKPGMTLGDVERLGDQCLEEKLKDMALLTEGRTVKDYRWHAISHHLGWDTHDVCHREAPFVPGVVITMEVGIYVPQWAEGVRIEDDILITQTGCENLSAEIPRSPGEIEALFIE